MSKPTKLQKEVLEIMREELDFMKKAENINSLAIPTEIDNITEKMMRGTMDPKLEPKHCDRLSDILYEIITFIKDLER